jgi:chromosome segregation ATPase
VRINCFAPNHTVQPPGLNGSLAQLEAGRAELESASATAAAQVAAAEATVVDAVRGASEARAALDLARQKAAEQLAVAAAHERELRGFADGAERALRAAQAQAAALAGAGAAAAACARQERAAAVAAADEVARLESQETALQAMLAQARLEVKDAVMAREAAELELGAQRRLADNCKAQLGGMEAHASR